MIELIEKEVDKIKDEKLRTVVVCVGFGGLIAVAITEKIIEYKLRVLATN